MVNDNGFPWNSAVESHGPGHYDFSSWPFSPKVALTDHLNTSALMIASCGEGLLGLGKSQSLPIVRKGSQNGTCHVIKSHAVHAARLLRTNKCQTNRLLLIVE
jgi:hypothetical protein